MKVYKDLDSSYSQHIEVLMRLSAITLQIGHTKDLSRKIFVWISSY